MTTWFKRMTTPRLKGDLKASVTTGLWTKCARCGEPTLKRDVEANLATCPHCDLHFRMTARERLGTFLDADSITELAPNLSPCDPLEFQDSKAYGDRVAQARDKADESEAFVLVEGDLCGRPIVAGSFVFRFMGGSMGSVVGEKIALGFEVAAEKGVPIVIFSASGGARMQEGILSLMQMAKTAAAISRYREATQPFFSVLTDPTTGGVAASVAMLGDIIIAEPGALVGFAGPRVIEQTIGQKLPEGFQRSEFLLDHGVIDMIVPRSEMRSRIAKLIELMVP